MPSTASEVPTPLSRSRMADLQSYYDKLAPNRERSLRWHAYYYRELQRFYQFTIPAGSRVLELGCGTGSLLNAVAPARGLGIDFSPAMVEEARKKYPHLEFRVMDAHALPLHECFDFIILSDLMGDLEDVLTVFQQLHKVSHASTRIVINYYNYLWEPVLKLGERLRIKTKQALQNWLPMADVANLLDLSGFEMVRRGTFMLLPVYLPLISWLVNKILAPLPFLRNLCLVEFMVARPSPSSESYERNRPFPSEKALTCSVVIPCRNEAGNIEAAVARLPKMGSYTEIIFVDGSSTDGTVEKIRGVIEEFKRAKDIRLIHQGAGTGKGDAVRKGFEAAQGDVLMILDADLTVAPEDLPKFFAPLAAGKAEFVNGSRLVYPREDQAMRFLNLLGNKFFSLFFTWILGQRIRDTLCGTKVLLKRDYSRIAANRGFLGDLDPFGDFDLLFGAAKLNLKIVEVPVRYRERVYGDTKIRRFRHGWLLLKMAILGYRRFKLL